MTETVTEERAATKNEQWRERIAEQERSGLIWLAVLNVAIARAPKKATPKAAPHAMAVKPLMYLPGDIRWAPRDQVQVCPRGCK